MELRRSVISGFKTSVAISGATSFSYTTAASSTSETDASFAVEVSNSVGNVTSNTVTLTVKPPSVAPLLAGSSSATFTVGSGGLFTVTTAGTPPPSISQSGALPRE